jgi:type II secretory ATPase GspE/PulE/Tfp pilus assembly ATPase PilB-like protein
MAQRLVRRLCRDCRRPVRLSEEEFEEFVSEYGAGQFKATGIEYSPELPVYQPVGCERCANTGYSGRMGIYELMNGTPEIKRMIKRQATTEALFEQAVNDGMSTLKQDGILKVLKGYTDIREVRRVCIN